MDSIEDARVTPSLEAVARLYSALGIEAELVVRAPFLVDGDRQRDRGHALCGSYAQRRLERAGYVVRREVEVVHGRSHGWIDLLAFHPSTGTLVVVEIKTQLDDLGRIERTVAWYEREAWAAARRLGWRPRVVAGWLLVLDTAAAGERITANRDALAAAFPSRAPGMAAWLGGSSAIAAPSRGLALIDPRSRRRAWLLRTRPDGRRSPAPYRDYADFVQRRG